MPSFQDDFVRSKGQPIVHQGRHLVMSDYFPTEDATTFRLTIETCNGSPVREDSASAWARDRGREHRTPEGLFRTSVDGLVPWRNLEPPGQWRQGVSVRLVHKDAKGRWKRGAAERVDGQFVINGQSISGQDGVALWQSREWDAVEFEVRGAPTTLAIHNLWDCGNGVVQAWQNGAAMIVEPLPNGRRYRCNDGEADDDFDDIVFRLERSPTTRTAT